MSAREDLAAVSPELRRAVLPFVTPPGNARILRVNRFVARLTTPSGCEVETAERFVGDGGLRVVVTTTHDGGSPRPAVLWIHGGGYVLGSPQFEGFLTGPIACEIGAVVVSPDYRLAPEHPYPAALDDCMATLRWMRDHADELGIDPGRVAVGGASAGGGLSAAVAQRSHDEGISLRAQVLVYPMLDDRTVLRADHAGRGRFMWTPASSRFGWTSYLGREPRMSDAPEYAVPARREQLEGLAPAWIGVGDLDLLYDEDVAYAGRLRAAGVPCELVTVPGMYHAADGLAPKAPSMQRFRASMLDHLRTYLQAS
ncbi:alpha/beta hydrolase [Mycobacterium sp. Y57]|uniref:alpha/beta hydrolase n=1 Tax=Mycolicibacterium xanthum TaxID=2796469 RepID=UPI001C848DDD|nr:alpha/beta hydrolase [Mycolicibacterium xanthum]